MSDDDRCDHRLPTGSCPFCKRGLPAKPEPALDPENVVQLDDLDDEREDPRTLRWWDR